KNQLLLPEFRRIAKDAGCTPAQLALAWLLQKAPHIIPIPGTTSVANLSENLDSAGITLSKNICERVEGLINQTTVSGGRYPPATQSEVDTEEFCQTET
ncbi:MAG: aldo/keto reductase, partial [Parvularculaceae bacterium]